MGNTETSEVKTLIIYGDSILRGVTYTPNENPMGRYHVAKKKVAPVGVRVINRSKMGQTIEYGLARIEQDIERGVLGPGVIALIEYGGNDCEHDWDAVAEDPLGKGALHEQKVPPQQYCEKLAQAIAAVRSCGAVPVICTLLPIDSERYFSFITEIMGREPESILRFLGTKQQLGKTQSAYSAMAAFVADKTKTALLPLRSAFAESGFETLLSSDGVHPTEEGYAAAFRFIEEWISAYCYAR